MAQLAWRGRRTKNADQGRRLLALAEIYDGGSRTKAAGVGGMVQISEISKTRVFCAARRRLRLRSMRRAHVDAVFERASAEKVFQTSRTEQ